MFVEGAQLRCDHAGNSRWVTLASVRPHKGRLLLRIDGVDSAETAQAMAGSVLLAPRERIPLEPGEFFDDDLTGCAVVGTDGRTYGTVDRVEHYPVNDMLIVGGRMVPMVSAIVREIDPAARRIVIDPPAGLLD